MKGRNEKVNVKRINTKMNVTETRKKRKKWTDEQTNVKEREKQNKGKKNRHKIVYKENIQIWKPNEDLNWWTLMKQIQK